MRGIGNTVPAADVSASGQAEGAAFCRQSTEKLCIFPVRFAGREPGGDIKGSGRLLKKPDTVQAAQTLCLTRGGISFMLLRVAQRQRAARRLPYNKKRNQICGPGTLCPPV